MPCVNVWPTEIRRENNEYWFLKNNFIYSFMFGCAGSSLLCWLFSSCGDRGLLSFFGVQASHCGGFSCCRAQARGTWASVVVVKWIQLPHGMWNLPTAGIKPLSCALAGFLTTGPPRKSCVDLFNNILWFSMRRGSWYLKNGIFIFLYGSYFWY